jgi:phosphonoacetaldehyde hydrolase
MDIVFRRSYRGPIKAVVCDWAGTTVDYGSLAPTGVFLEVFRQAGVEITTGEAREPMGMYKRDHIQAITRMPRVEQRWRDAHGRSPNEDDVDRMFESFIPLQLACIADHADLIPGCLEAVAALRDRGIKIGSTTGYNTQMVEILAAEAGRRGFQPDATVCASDVSSGRPAPWMCMENLNRLNVYPVEAAVKVDDTIPGIEAGLNCGMWTIAVAKTGNELGLSREEVDRLPADELERRMLAAHRRLAQSGAHFVVDGIHDVPRCLDEIERRLAAGEKP